MQAKQALQPSGTNNGLLITAVNYGLDGNNIRFGIEYPKAANQAISSNVIISNTTDIAVYLQSGAARVGGSWDNTTTFSVSNISTNVYRYSQISGTAPNFVTAGVSVGDIVTIPSTANFNANNLGTYKIVAVSQTSFDVFNINGVTQSGPIILNSSSDLSFYALGANNKATDVAAYCAENLNNYITVSQLSTGTGAISTSTWTDTLGSEFVQLMDGENYVYQSNIGTTIAPLNQFQVKKPFALPQYLPGTNFYLIPTRAKDIVNF